MAFDEHDGLLGCYYTFDRANVIISNLHVVDCVANTNTSSGSKTRLT